MSHKFNGVKLKNADLVDSYGLYLPNNHQITKDEILKICDIVNSAG